MQTQLTGKWSHLSPLRALMGLSILSTAQTYRRPLLLEPGGLGWVFCESKAWVQILAQAQTYYEALRQRTQSPSPHL